MPTQNQSLQRPLASASAKSAALDFASTSFNRKEGSHMSARKEAVAGMVSFIRDLAGNYPSGTKAAEVQRNAGVIRRLEKLARQLETTGDLIASVAQVYADKTASFRHQLVEKLANAYCSKTMKRKKKAGIGSMLGTAARGLGRAGAGMMDAGMNHPKLMMAGSGAGLAGLAGAQATGLSDALPQVPSWITGPKPWYPEGRPAGLDNQGPPQGIGGHYKHYAREMLGLGPEGMHPEEHALQQKHPWMFGDQQAAASPDSSAPPAPTPPPSATAQGGMSPEISGGLEQGFEDANVDLGYSLEKPKQLLANMGEGIKNHPYLAAGGAGLLGLYYMNQRAKEKERERMMQMMAMRGGGGGMGMGGGGGHPTRIMEFGY